MTGSTSLLCPPVLSAATDAWTPFDYILVLDFEATCEEVTPPDYVYEIIEFPVVLVDTHLLRPMAEFHSFVRPREKPILSDFCTALTGIGQEEIDAAPTLDRVIALFEKWFLRTVPPHANVIFATDGSADLQHFMFHQAIGILGYRFPPVFFHWIDVKKLFSTFFQCHPGKIKAMLDVLQRPMQGRLHSGLDDARNVASIVIGLLHYGSSLMEAPLCHARPSAGCHKVVPHDTKNHTTTSSGGERVGIL